MSKAGDAISRRAKQRRLELGYSFQKLEELTGISRSTLQRYEANGMEGVYIYKLQIIANALEMSFGYLLGEESKEVSNKDLEALNSLLKNIDCAFKYSQYDDEDDNIYFYYDNEKKTIAGSQIKELQNAIIDYSKFKLFEMGLIKNISSDTSDTKDDAE